MSDAAYLALWLALSLGAVAVLSALLTRRHLRGLRGRRLQAQRLLEALEQYDAWVALQRHAPAFSGESTEAARALDAACTIRMACFPELGSDMAQLLALHNRLLHFLAAQQALRHTDPEAWLDSDHDARFLALWRQQRLAAQAMRDTLRLLCRAELPAAGASTFA